MTPPPSVSHKLGEVCKLRKALYDLKQAPRAWYKKFEIVVTSLSFVSIHHDSVLFVKHSSVGRILFSLYVDDMIITGDDSVGIESLKLELAHHFAMKDLGLLSYFLGIETKWLKIFSIDAKAKYPSTNGDPFPYPSLYWTIVCQVVAVTTSEIVWLRWLLADMGVPISHYTPLHCDNRSAIHIARNSVFHEGTKHIEIYFHFTRHHLQVGTISLLFVPSALHIADVFTKPLWIMYLFSD
ncbi:uncharacterized mitochondrial protein-like protein [Tanacetum coccineum]